VGKLVGGEPGDDQVEHVRLDEGKDNASDDAQPAVDALDQEKNIFGDVGGVISDALQIVSDEHQIHGARNGGALFLHERHQLVPQQFGRRAFYHTK